MTKIKRFTEEGIKKYEELISERRSEYSSLSKVKKKEYETKSVNKTLLENYSEDVTGAGNIEKINFSNKFHLGKYLFDQLQNCAPKDVARDKGLWNWITAYYFEQLFPGPRGGPANERFILNFDFHASEVRHLTQFPWQLYSWHKEDSKYILNDPVNSGPERIESLMKRVDIKRNTTIIKTANELYFDEETKNFKPGAGRKRGEKEDTKKEMSLPGSITRFIHLCRNRIPLTYDTFEMSCDELLDKLPEEFEKWRK